MALKHGLRSALMHTSAAGSCSADAALYVAAALGRPAVTILKASANGKSTAPAPHRSVKRLAR